MLVIKLINDGTGKNNIGNYNYTVLVTMMNPNNEVGLKIIASGRVEGHNQADGWEGLIDKLREQK